MPRQPRPGFDEVDLIGFDAITLVSSSIPGENNRLPPDANVNLVIDHHPGEEPDAEFIARHEEASSTTIILVEYVYPLDIRPERELATAMLFAIRRETLDLIGNTPEKEYLVGTFRSSSLHFSNAAIAKGASEP